MAVRPRSGVIPFFLFFLSDYSWRRISLFFFFAKDREIESEERRDSSESNPISLYVYHKSLYLFAEQKEDLALQSVGTVRFTRLERREQEKEKDVHSARLAATNPRE